MDGLSGAYAACCGLLAVGGAMKAAQPTPARQALGSLGVRLPLPAVRAVGVGEVAVATVTLFVGGPAWALVALCYAGFVAVAVALWRRDEVASCGCFGEVDSRPSGLHVGVTAAGLGLSVVAAAQGASGPVAEALDDAGEGPLVLALAAIATYLVVVALAQLPGLAAAMRDLRRSAR
ncbi:MAG: hypothetical protein GEV08_24935 [Acidimicrobiia bacterium]|nr:hypothetical protein [Acidimicrobiia bacterium]